MIPSHRVSQFLRYSAGATETRSTGIAIETEVALSVNGETWLSFRCSPDNLEWLAAGFLFNESHIQSASEIASIQVCEQGDHLDVWLHHDASKPSSWSRSSGCQGGFIQPGANSLLPVESSVHYPISTLLACMDIFLTQLNKPDFPQRGVHTTMLFDSSQVKSISNDIGRHNTLDKISGDCLLNQVSLSQPALITTGRISSEMVQKTARMKIPMVISLHSISDLAIKAADELGITLVGHGRRAQVDIYVHPERIIL
jgi:FdhD protein